jgi:hypothetical protein
MPRPALRVRPGFHGKLLAHGDFVGRGLLRVFLDPFVRWLDAIVRDQLDPRRSDAWRFMPAPSVACFAPLPLHS